MCNAFSSAPLCQMKCALRRVLLGNLNWFRETIVKSFKGVAECEAGLKFKGVCNASHGKIGYIKV